MDMPALPSIKASVVREQAHAFAQRMIRHLDQFNAEHSTPHMSKAALKYLENKEGMLSGPWPEDLYSSFEEAFYHYIAAHLVILPDQEPLDMEG
jgi:hypothetical protein